MCGSVFTSVQLLNGPSVCTGGEFTAVAAVLVPCMGRVKCLSFCVCVCSYTSDSLPVCLAAGVRACTSTGSGQAQGGQILSGQMIQALHYSLINYQLITVMQPI